MLFSQRKKNKPIQNYADWPLLVPYLKPFVDAFPHRFRVSKKHIQEAIDNRQKDRDTLCPIALAYKDNRIPATDAYFTFTLGTTIYQQEGEKVQFGVRIDIKLRDEQMSKGFLFEFVGENLFAWYDAFIDAVDGGKCPPSICVALDHHDNELVCSIVGDTD